MNLFKKNKHTVRTLTNNTLVNQCVVANISEILELKETRKLVIRVFYIPCRIMASTSTSMSLYVCIRASAESRSVFIIERKYIFTLKEVALDTGIVRRMEIILCPRHV